MNYMLYSLSADVLAALGLSIISLLDVTSEEFTSHVSP